MQNLLGRKIDEFVALLGVSIYFAYIHAIVHPGWNTVHLALLILPALVLGLEYHIYIWSS